MFKAKLMLASVVGLTFVLNACGGGAQPAFQNAGSPSASSSGTSGNNTPSAGSGGSTSSSGNPAPSSTPAPPTTPPLPPTAFMANLIAAGGSNHGQISINLNGQTGDGSFRLIGSTPNDTYSLGFCEWPCPTGRPGGASVGISEPINTDANGNASMTFHFPTAGTWSGLFQLNGHMTVSSGFDMPANGLEFQSALFRCRDITHTLDTGLPGSCGSDPLTSGFITVSGTAVHVSLTGAAPSVSYAVHYCGAQIWPCTRLGTVTVDAHGDGSADFDYIKTAGTQHDPSIFYLDGHDGNGGTVTQFGSGFRTP